MPATIQHRENIADLIRAGMMAGKSPKQAAAIAMKAADSSRIVDQNNWFEVKKNPISKVGVFPYLGASIGADDADKIYYIYRPESELSSPSCVDSFRLLPLVDDHEMLGSDAGFTPAEDYGVHGVAGENVQYENGLLFTNLKVWSESLKKKIQDGKVELSCGYSCRYEMTPGIWNGQRYDGIQRDIVGNHIALVDQGRMGPDVRVLDHSRVTVDATGEIEMAKEAEVKKVATAADATGATSLDALKEVVGKVVGMVESVVTRLDAADAAAKKAIADKAAADKKAKDAKSKDDDTNPDDSEEDPMSEEGMGEDDAEAEAAKTDAEKAKDKAAKDKAAKDKKDAKMGKDTADKVTKLEGQVTDLPKNITKAVMDELSKRDGLIEKLTPHIGAFDAKGMTVAEVAKYGVEKLKLEAADGQELATLNGYLHARPAPADDVFTAGDAAAEDAAADSGILEQFADKK